jgi:hypothetical protein
MTTPQNAMPFTMRILGRLDAVRFPDEETGLAALDQFAAERGLDVHYNVHPDLESAIATAHPYGGDPFIDAVAVLRQEPLTPARFRVTLRCLYTGKHFDVWVSDRARLAAICAQLDASEVSVTPSLDAELHLAHLLTLFDVPRQLH